MRNSRRERVEEKEVRNKREGRKEGRKKGRKEGRKERHDMTTTTKPY